jgi:PIN domain nuclease of toxin-antitoxin system
MQTLAISPLPIALEHVLRVHHLPSVHKDPFDRLILAQALVESLPVVSTDRHFPAYGVQVIA